MGYPWRPRILGAHAQPGCASAYPKERAVVGYGTKGQDGRPLRRPVGLLNVVTFPRRLGLFGLFGLFSLCLLGLSALFFPCCVRFDPLPPEPLAFPSTAADTLSSSSAPTSLLSSSPLFTFWRAVLQMVVLHSGRAATRALAVLGMRVDNGTSSTNTSTTDAGTTDTAYTAQTVAAVGTLQEWYDEADGLWNTTGWWNGANLLTTLADFAALDSGAAERLGLVDIFANTYTAAQESTVVAVKTVDALGLVHSSYTTSSALVARDGYPGFLNDYYDDEGWWALALLRAHDVTGRAAYLASAESIFADMQTGVSTDVCGGGIWWSKDRTYKNAIANELYLAVAASLANRAANATARASYRALATDQWAWFRDSGMINSNGTVNDGLVVASNGSCTNNGLTVWSYNQGVLLGGLVELYSAQASTEAGADPDTSLLPTAVAIARAAIDALSVNGILHESCEANNGDCGTDGSTFKGVFLRNLQYLSVADLFERDREYIRTFILDNAASIWANDRNITSGQLGLVWSGPVDAGSGPSAGTHGSALDCLVAAVAVD